MYVIYIIRSVSGLSTSKVPYKDVYGLIDDAHREESEVIK